MDWKIGDECRVWVGSRWLGSWRRAIVEGPIMPRVLVGVRITDGLTFPVGHPRAGEPAILCPPIQWLEPSDSTNTEPPIDAEEGAEEIR